jgi:hypothetical protein
LGSRRNALGLRVLRRPTRSPARNAYGEHPASCHRHMPASWTASSPPWQLMVGCPCLGCTRAFVSSSALVNPLSCLYISNVRALLILKNPTSSGFGLYAGCPCSSVISFLATRPLPAVTGICLPAGPPPRQPGSCPSPLCPVIAFTLSVVHLV